MPEFLKSFVLFCQRAFYNPHTRVFEVVNDCLAVVIIASILAIICESVAAFARYYHIFFIIEYITVCIFLLEYFCRIIGSANRLAYFCSFFGIIDLLAVLPTLLHLTDLTPLKSVRALRILRFLRIMRAVKIMRLKRLKKVSKRNMLALIRFDIQIYLLAVMCAITILGCFAYIFEHNHPSFANIPLSMLWVLETLLGGAISKTTPQTYIGIAIFMLARFVSFILLGFLIRIISDIVNYFLLGKKSYRGKSLTSLAKKKF